MYNMTFTFMMNKHLHNGDNCPKCSYGLLIQKMNRDYQPFLSCDDFPECKFSCNITNEDYKKFLKK